MGSLEANRRRLYFFPPSDYEAINLTEVNVRARLVAIGSLPVYLCKGTEDPEVQFTVLWDGRPANPRLRIYDFARQVSDPGAEPAVVRYYNSLGHYPSRGDQPVADVSGGLIRLGSDNVKIDTSSLEAKINAGDRLPRHGDVTNVPTWIISTGPSIVNNMQLLAPRSHILMQ